MRERPFKQVDVFTAVPYLGNPLAVVLDGTDLSTQQMQAFTNWTNLSEAAFLLPATHADADYRVRIFCPGRELAFAGHPTLGSCHAWLEAGGKPKASLVVQECGIGMVPIRVQQAAGGRQLAFAAPPLRRSGPLAASDLTGIALGLGLRPDEILAHAWCDNGPAWRAVLLKSAQQVLQLKPDAALLAGLDIGVIGRHDQGHDCAFEVRAFFPGNNGLTEDPVTGSLNAALAQWLIGAKLAPSSYLVSQGTVLGRAGRVQVDRDETGHLWIGGASRTCLEGSLHL